MSPSGIRNVLHYCTYLLTSLWYISAMRKAPNDISQAKMVDIITRETLLICVCVTYFLYARSSSYIYAVRVIRIIEYYSWNGLVHWG